MNILENKNADSWQIFPNIRTQLSSGSLNPSRSAEYLSMSVISGVNKLLSNSI
ncbi:MAG: hypothetical protein ACJAT5_000516 [Lentimonas sp.]|jgi:hypothetical protein